ncbi:uncharacterized protein BKA55DRAFT_562909 [Fusarium redolens]|uniref:Uncharacterized protein n=1 Tax=Fusarium redolens TaxID=48865 RepID=A0A9P9KMU4_FUSRE|nr:uncharacterized protein BKA55DRAFT_562909 [Fusarium redolens]KAH7259634.1 hypothetical protein BKA55DRAFT_562909 [Fusarium redolens]
MMIIQGLRGLQYTGTLNGFPRSVSIMCQDISVLKTNHLQQEYRLDPRPRVSSSAPARSDWQHNYNLMVRQFSCDMTRVLVEAPAANDPTMIFTTSEAISAGVLMSQGKRRPCDSCLIAYPSSSDERPLCEPDPSHPHGCCKLCSLFNRPCTFTASSQLPRLFGDREPWRHETYPLSVYPNGPFRWLIYHRSMSNEELNANDFVQEPFEERFGLPEEDDGAEGDESGEAQGQVVEVDEE